MIFSSFRWNSRQFLDLTNPLMAYVYFKKKRLNLISGYLEDYSIDLFLSRLERFQLQDEVKQPRVYHFYYQFGLFLFGMDESIGEGEPLVVEIEYNNSRLSRIAASSIKKINLSTLERPTWTEYRNAFNQVQDNLLDGNCYQLNLTYPFDFTTDIFFDPRDLRDYLMSHSGVSAYAHVTHFDNEVLFSNSPECLFHFENNQILTMPIKGTLRLEKDWKSHWRELINDPKQEAELFMIIDLLKNDLNKIDSPRTQIRKLKAPLRVPGLLHQYAELTLKLENEVGLGKILKQIFPGGSISGAPKKRVLQLIQEIERWDRGFYTGSTLLCLGKKKIASINIRSAHISLNERLWRYGSGGGITLLSKAALEFKEMESKVDSFLTLLRKG
jgi:para-aminobenzoate synthetase component 1